MGKGIYGRLVPTPQKEEEDLPDDLQELISMQEQETISIDRLEQSNHDLTEALKECDDADFRIAVAENRQILERKRQRHSEISEKIRQLTAAAACVPAGPVVRPAGYGGNRGAPEPVPVRPAEPPAYAPAEAAQVPEGLDL